MNSHILFSLTLFGTGCSDYGFLSSKDVAEPVIEDTTARPEDPQTAPGTVDFPDTETEPPAEEETDMVALHEVYAHTSGRLFSVDPNTGDTTDLGEFRYANGTKPKIVDIAIDLDGLMVGGTLEDGLVAINPNTAEVEHLCDTSVDMMALAFTSGGTLVAGGEDVIDIVNVESCETFRLVEGGYQTSGDLVGLPDGYLYWTVKGNGSDDLARLDPSTGHAEIVGSTGHDNLFGLGYDDGELFGFSSLGSIVRIQPHNGYTTVLVEDETSWWGATTNPVLW